MHQDEAILLFGKINKKMNAKQWGRFIEDLKSKADNDD